VLIEVDPDQAPAMLAIDNDPNADQKRLIVMARRAKWTTPEICRAIGISRRTLQMREAELRQAQQAVILADALLEHDRAAS
jgi:hypothetical protein